MGNLFRKEDCLTVPNLLSLVRILLIPVIVWLYYREKAYLAAAAVIGISGLTDIADGIIARKYDQISDLGKVLDPFADKLSQLAIMGCLLSRYRMLWYLVALFLVKETVCTLLGALVVFRKGTMIGAKWFGKANTVVLYSVLVTLILLPGLDRDVANGMIGLSSAVMAMAFLLYLRSHCRALFRKNK